MKSKYRISEKAIEDIENIWFFTYKKWSLKQADRYHRLIINEIEFIVDNYNLSKDVGYIRTGYRMSKVKSHLVFYKMSGDDIIEIIRILHKNMDIENRLKE